MPRPAPFYGPRQSVPEPEDEPEDEDISLFKRIAQEVLDLGPPNNESPLSIGTIYRSPCSVICERLDSSIHQT